MPKSCEIKQDPSQWETKPTFQLNIQLTVTFKQTLVLLVQDFWHYCYPV